jgi:hypothetical protein
MMGDWSGKRQADSRLSLVSRKTWHRQSGEDFDDIHHSGIYDLLLLYRQPKPWALVV